MKIAYIHNDKKINTGANHINSLIISSLKKHNIDVKNYYPRFSLTNTPLHFRGFNNILFFYSLLEKKNQILKCDIIQGTTYTPIAFLQFAKPVVSHFGSTTIGFLRSVPKTKKLEPCCSSIIYEMRKEKIISCADIQTRRPLNDIATIEYYSAEKADLVVATSEIVKNDLISDGVDPQKIKVIYNAIENYWFDQESGEVSSEPVLIFLGRIGEDPFTLKLKGVDRLVCLYRKFPQIQKVSIVMSKNKKLISWLGNKIPNHQVFPNLIKTEIPGKLATLSGGIFIITSRYEGFSLSLLEGMSQGLIPISFPVGVAPEIIKNGENGYLVNSLEEAEEIIKKLINDYQLRCRLSRNAKELTKNFKSEIMAEKMVKLYKEILEKKLK
ncbi:MAG: glycosyltransferase family 4 protein [Weeksellaceae bacterium]|jgi:glycosyltransferase involved in cell wall biosynthesis|nr:glycosyltransferase family 4 protein [Weeksellaceae bacterium]